MAEGVDGTERLEAGHGRIDISLTMIGSPFHGVLLHYWKYGDGNHHLYYSKGDLRRLREWVRTKDGDLMPVGLFVPLEAAWRAVAEYIQTDGALPKGIEWIASDDIPPYAFPDPADRVPDRGSCRIRRRVRTRTPRGATVIIADRRLAVSSPSGDREVVVRLYRPEQDDAAWLCRYEIDWPDRRWSSSAAGVDAVQALVLALQKIGIELYASSYHQAGSLKWTEPGRGYGFPVTSNVRDLLTGDDVNL